MADQDLQEKLRTLIRKRGSQKQRITYFEKYIDDLITASQETNFSATEEMVIELEQRIGSVKEVLSEFEDIQIQLETFAPDNELLAHYTYREELESKYHIFTAKGQGLLRRFKNEIGLNNRDNDDLSVIGSHHSGNGEENRSLHDDSLGYIGGVKLPTIEVPSFHGNYDTWLEFRDTFESLINQHQGLTNIHKYHYLRSFLKGEAKQVIKSLDFSGNNYEKAWNLVCKRYNNTRLLINNHIKALFDMEKLSNESSSKLRSFADNIDKHLSALQSLGQPIDKWDTLIVHMSSLKLDRESNRKWEEYQTGTDPASLEKFMEFLTTRADFLESLELKAENTNTSESKSRKYSSRTLVTESQKCAVCQGEHSLYNCGEFQALNVTDRVNRIKSLRLCMNCLRRGHFLGKCNSKSLCKQCNSKHHTLLHNSVKTGEVKPPENTTQNASVKTDIALWSHTENQTSLLGTVLIIAFDKFNNPHNIRAVLDCGSQSSYITTRVFELLGLEPQSIEINVVGLGLKSSKVTQKCIVKIQSMHNAFNKTVTCLVIPQITGPLPEYGFDYSSLEIPNHVRLADPSFNKSQNIDMLIGADYFWELLCAAQIKLGNNKPVLQKTRFGWIVSGRIHSSSGNSSGRTHCNLSCESNAQLTRFWEIEENLATKRVMSVEESACEDNFQKITVRDCTGRFIVSIPFKQDVNLLGDSKEKATKLLCSLESRFQNNDTLKIRYENFMQEYQKLGHMTLVNSDDSNATYYMPHHGVIKEESETTKLRVVFNASSPSSSGYSLNDLQYVGPTIQEDLFSILLRFRQYPYVVSADIAKMYRQVLITDEQRPLQRILWRSDPSLPISTFNLNTVTYGTASAPFLAIRCLFQLAEDYQSEFPKSSEVVRRDFYVDDMLTGSDSIELLQQTCDEVSTILASGQFELRKWISNNIEVLKRIDKSLWSSHSVNFLEDNHAKTLGVGWSSKTDCLLYRININESSKHVSKRSILSDISRIFDPLGLLAPVIIVAKILLQCLWQLKISWDESVPLDLYTKWISFRSELPSLNDLQIPRHVISSNAIRVELHGFSDASERAYGACIYLRSFQSNGGIKVELLCAKGRVSPLSSLTIPRLELCGALILARLFRKVFTSLNMTFDDCVFWSDSTIVLGWLNTPPNKLKQFVGNRVAEVQTLTRPHQWRHVSTQDNPADMVSRGINPCNLQSTQLWWSGPSWLAENKPLPNEVIPVVGDLLPDMKAVERCSLISKMSNNFAEPFNKFSSLSKLERVVAYCLRFGLKQSRGIGPLSNSEIQCARLRLALIAQRGAFSDEISDLEQTNCVNPKSKLAKLAPFLHSDGTIRVGGRLQNTNYSFNKIHPIVLDCNHDFAKLLFETQHKQLLHCSPQLLLAAIKECYWPIGGRNLARKTVRNCITCYRLNPKPCVPMMGNLPEARVVPSPPFYKTGVDYAGPLMIINKRGRGSKVRKCYVCIFVCFCTKAVHLEAVSDLSTEAFLMSMRRFVARRGKPIEVYSDNGTNFVGANNELQELGDMLNNNADSLSQQMAFEGLSWHFIPPRSPHFGGIWEAGVRSVKHHLKRVAKNAHLTFEELQTLLSQIESVLNSRPLYPMSSEPHDLTPLTPGHFLIGRPLTALPDVDLRNINENRLSHYQRIQQLHQHFWARWSKEYLSELQLRYKWNHPNFDIKIGSLVLLKDDNLAPLNWKLGRICELHPGRDGHTRVVSVKTSTGTVRRAVTKLCPLPLTETN